MLDFTDGSIANGIIQLARVLGSNLLAADGVFAQHAGEARHTILLSFISSPLGIRRSS